MDVFHKVKEGNIYKFPYINNGEINPLFNSVLPQTGKYLKELEKVNEGPIQGIPFSSSYISILAPKSSIEKHYGPSNIKLRCHVPLIIPSDEEACFIRVGG